MKTMLKFSFVLASYTVVACVGLAFVYNLTSPVIAASEAAELKAALNGVFPNATEFTDITGRIQSPNAKIEFNNAFVAKKDGVVEGIVIKATGPTYASGTLLIGVDTDGKLKPIRFMALTDTPGLGLKALEEPFKGQFSGKSARDAFKVGKPKTDADVIAISGATITSRGVANILKAAGSAAADYLAKE